MASDARPASSVVFFDRRELNALLRLYGQMVAQAEWRDYAIDGAADSATFSVFRRTQDNPLYQIEKRPALANRQGAWAVIGQGGQILRRGQSVEAVLRLFDRQRFKVIE